MYNLMVLIRIIGWHCWHKYISHPLIKVLEKYIPLSWRFYQKETIENDICPICTVDLPLLYSLYSSQLLNTHSFELFFSFSHPIVILWLILLFIPTNHLKTSESCNVYSICICVMASFIKSVCITIYSLQITHLKRWLAHVNQIISRLYKWTNTQVRHSRSSLLILHRARHGARMFWRHPSHSSLHAESSLVHLQCSRLVLAFMI